MARKFTTTVRLDGEDAAALKRARKDGIPASALIRQGLRVVAARYYRRRAEGGVGLIITEGTFIPHPSAGHDENAPRIYGDDALKMKFFVPF